MTTKVAKSSKTSGRGAKPGERRGGRQKGTPNKATASIRDIAQKYTADAVNALVEIVKDKRQPAAARVSAANGLLDRAYGKPTQSIDLGSEGGLPVTVIERRIVDTAN